ncbi:MAG: glycosyltransferase family 39 protein [Candidatus Woesebacteria bacterium]|nr:glycosyltransferase family 39 protein [Candidatus Woesebacteria bacterium]
MIILSLLLGIILRVYKIGTNYYFSGELGKELLYVRQLILAGKIPLVGLTTSHEWLTYGPVYYWILTPLVKIFGQSPYILFWLALAASTTGTYLSFFLFSKIINKKFAVILSFFISLSPLWIWATRLSKLHTFFFILIPLVVYFLYKIWNKDKKYFFWLGMAYGLLFSFHYSQIPLFLVLMGVFWIKRKTLKLGNYVKFVFGLILPNITILIYDAKNGFNMTKNLLLWIPYRVAGFIGIYPKNNLDIATGESTILAFNQFFGQNLFWNSSIWILGSIIFVVLFVVFLVQNYKKFTKDFFVFYVLSSTTVQCFALLIHTTPPIHYFFPIFLNFGLLLAFYVNKYWNKKSTIALTVFVFVFMFISGFLSLNKEHAGDVGYVPLKTQEEITDNIIKDAGGKPFSLKRIGPYDYLPEEYSQNYKYLILSKGGNLIDASKNVYTIIEDPTKGQVSVEKK